MIYVSLADVLAVANDHFAATLDETAAYALATASLFAGVLIMAFIDWLVHRWFHRVSAAAKGANPRVQLDEEHSSGSSHGDSDHGSSSIRAVAAVDHRGKLLMMATVVSAAIVLHNLPEGMATYAASFDSVQTGAPLALAIAVHNLPEGLSVAMPIYHATGSKLRAIGLGALSGMAEPLGAVLASLVANEHSPEGAFGGLFGLTAGMMLFVCVAELLPAAYAERSVPQELIIAAFFFGCAVMATSLVLEKVTSAAPPPARS